jgi:hypothetical protein
MILVTGLEFSGTSLVAGLLHHLGVDMGAIETPAQLQRLQAAWQHQQCEGALRAYRSYECQRFQAAAMPLLLQSTCENRYHAQALGTLLERYSDSRPHGWGLKSTLLLFLAWWEGLDSLDARWIVTHRRLDAVAVSGATYCGTTSPAALWAAQVRGVQQLARQRLLSRLVHHPVLLLDFDDIRVAPRVAITRVVNFCHLAPTDGQQAAAEAFVRKE